MIVEAKETDILIIGGGLAGSYAAIKAKEAGAERVTLVSKGKLGKDSIATFGAGVWLSCFPEDDKDHWLKRLALDDTLTGGLYDEDWLNIAMDENHDRLLEMNEWGVEFEKTPDGKFARQYGRWKMPQCMFHGPQLMEAMAKKVKSSGIEVIGHTMVIDLLTESGKLGGSIIGAVGIGVRNGEFKVFKAKCTVLAAGSCGYKARFAGHKFQTGEAYAMAYRAGAILGGLEIGEIMQTTAADFDIQGLNMFQGFGGQFVNAQGERFLLEYDPENENHASMATISESSALEVRAGRGPIYLDMTRLSAEDVKKLKAVCPLPCKIMERAGVIVGDRIIKKMEWQPAFFGANSFGGGVVVNTKCETSLPRLYACGDAMSRPNLCWSGTLQGAAVSGARAGRFATEYAKEAKEAKVREEQIERLKKLIFAPSEREDGIEPDHIIIGLQEALIPYEVTAISRGDRLEKALKEVERIRDEEVPLLYASDPHYLRLANEVRSMVLVAEMYLRSRLLRGDSRDSCLREDYPYIDNINWLKWTRLKQEDGKMKAWAEDIPVERYKFKPKREKKLYPIFDVATRRGVKWG